MSPNEAQLRAALRDGEGESVNASLVIADAVEQRQVRRRRVYGVAAAAIVVAGVGVGVSQLRGHVAGESSGDAAAPALAQTTAGKSAAAGSVGSAGAERSVDYSAATHSAGTSTAETCPTTPSGYVLPGGGGSGQFGATEPLFTHAVQRITVCAYSAEASIKLRSTTVRGAPASAIATAFNAASAAPAPGPNRGCPLAGDGAGTLELSAVSAAGTKSVPVVITVSSCGAGMATNGTATRYLDKLPRRFLGLLDTGIPTSTSS